MSSVKIYLIGGFLGSGKTTLLQHILNWEIDLSSTIVLLNEFGAISVDGMLLESKGSEVVELANGCICCSMRGEFIENLGAAIQKFSPTRVLVETTGVADTLEVVAFMRESKIADRLVLNKVICVLDADLWEGKENFGSVFFNQIRAADLVLLNKVDLVEKEKVPHFLEEPTFHCRIEPDILEGDGTFSWFSKEDQCVTSEESGEGDLVFQSFVFQVDTILSEKCFREFLERVPLNVFRIKGTVSFGSSSFLLNHVSGKSHWNVLSAKTETKLVFVGWDMDAEMVKRDLQACREA